MSWNSKTWSWVKKYFSVNPKSTDGMPVVGKFRTPAVGSRPEKYTYPKSAASNISNNYYFQRDTRRNFPRTAIYTQKDLALLLEGAPVKPALSAEQATEQAVTTTAKAKPLAELLSSKKFYSLEKAAPAPRFGVQPQWKVSEDFVPPKDGSYFPMKVITC
ncbi:NADH-ubiquinone oxidoreductase 21 subunit [Choanephora cucurbitarum]|uniref:NADH-ubiquinone oxidoreductase 21 subunit n=1 Tax=Choanephora cucurbitarum TaxID=101091 RepID=A0A1C7N6Z9_9FUNG|nr:NADH-ubiquinone oxidoreductase 21 subunit [Choanephora cucurbitarum]